MSSKIAQETSLFDVKNEAINDRLWWKNLISRVEISLKSLTLGVKNSKSVMAS